MVSDKEVIKERIEVCKTCPEKRPVVNVCAKCGCFIPLKAIYEGNTCPLDKWIR